MRKFTLFLLIFLLVYSPVEITALEMGGEVESSLTGILNEENDLETGLSNKLNLELFIPSYGNTESRVEFDFVDIGDSLEQPQGEIPGVNLNGLTVKKMYIKHKENNYDITVGRQPISWSFGSLTNPVDFAQQAEFMEEETSQKFQDSVKLYFPFDWDTGLEMVGSWPRDTTLIKYKDDFKYGFRYRTGIEGYDVSFNYIKELAYESEIIPTEPQESQDRAGVSLKGNFPGTEAGVYGAVHYSKPEVIDIGEGKFDYLIGGDYSFTPENLNKFNLQLEYQNSQENSQDMILGNINYQIDDFSSINLVNSYQLEDSNLIMIPGYNHQIGENLELNLRGSYYDMKGESLWNSILDNTSGIVQAGLTYSF